MIAVCVRTAAAGIYHFTEMLTGGQSGYPTPDSSNKLCATNGQQGRYGGVMGGAELCSGASSDGLIDKSTCDRGCIENRCASDLNCVGFAEDTNGNKWRPVSQIMSIGANSAWHTYIKSTGAVRGAFLTCGDYTFKPLCRG